MVRTWSAMAATPMLWRWVEEPPPETTTTTEPSVPVQTVEAWAVSAHNEKLAIALVAVFGLGILAGFVLGKK